MEILVIIISIVVISIDLVCCKRKELGLCRVVTYYPRRQAAKYRLVFLSYIGVLLAFSNYSRLKSFQLVKDPVALFYLKYKRPIIAVDPNVAHPTARECRKKLMDIANMF